MRPLRPSRSQFFPLQLYHLPCFKDPPFRLSDSSFKLRPRDLSFCQFPAPRLKVSPQLSDGPLRIPHRCS
jgi:hypothetical protein